MCQEGAADLGAGAEKSCRDVGGADKKIPLMFRGAEKIFLFDELDKGRRKFFAIFTSVQNVRSILL